MSAMAQPSANDTRQQSKKSADETLATNDSLVPNTDVNIESSIGSLPFVYPNMAPAKRFFTRMPRTNRRVVFVAPAARTGERRRRDDRVRLRMQRLFP